MAYLLRVSKSLIPFLVFPMTLSCVGELKRPTATFRENRSVASVYQDAYTVPYSNSQQRLNIDRIIAAIKNSNARTTEEGLEALKSYNEFFAFFNLVYDSQSLQQATLQFPRVIVFGREPGLFLTFNGQPELSGYGTFEIAQFEGAKSDFREIVFKGDGARPNFTKEETEFESDQVIISKANPGKCAACHTSIYHPIWDRYHFWPGVFGSLNDGHPSETYYRELAQLKYKAFAAKWPNPESEGFRKFKETKHTHRLYKYVQFTPSQISLNSVADPSSLSRASQMSSFAESILDFKLGHFITNEKKLHRFRYAFLGALACDQKYSFIPMKIGNTYPEQSKEYKQLEAVGLNAQLAQLNRRIRRAKETFGESLLFNFDAELYQNLSGRLANEKFRPPMNSPERSSAAMHLLAFAKSKNGIRFRNIVEGQGLPFDDWGVSLERGTNLIEGNLFAVLNGMEQESLNPEVRTWLQKLHSLDNSRYDEAAQKERLEIEEGLCTRLQSASFKSLQ